MGILKWSLGVVSLKRCGLTKTASIFITGIPVSTKMVFILRRALDDEICVWSYPDSKVHGAKMGPIWGRQDPGGPHVGPMNFAIWVDRYGRLRQELYCYGSMRKDVLISFLQWQMPLVPRWYEQRKFHRTLAVDWFIGLKQLPGSHRISSSWWIGLGRLNLTVSPNQLIITQTAFHWGNGPFISKMILIDKFHIICGQYHRSPWVYYFSSLLYGFIVLMMIITSRSQLHFSTWNHILTPVYRIITFITQQCMLSVCPSVYLPTIMYQISWWRHKIEAFSALLALCAGNSPVTGDFPSQRPVTRSLVGFFYLRMKKRLSKQPWRWWFETTRHSLWRRCNVIRNAFRYWPNYFAR